jgi:hypothetical protein
LPDLDTPSAIMTSGSMVKLRVRKLRRSHIRTISLFLLAFGITAILGTRLLVSSVIPGLETGEALKPSWRHAFIQRMFGKGELDDDDVHLDVPFFEEPSVLRGKQSVLTTPRIPQSEYCTEAEYLDGAWTKRTEPITPSNIRQVFKLTDIARFRCPAKDAPPDDQISPDDPRSWSRIWEVAQWEWTTKSGCKKHDWSRWNFAKYCLRAKAGCT